MKKTATKQVMVQAAAVMGGKLYVLLENRNDLYEVPLCESMLFPKKPGRSLPVTQGKKTKV